MSNFKRFLSDERGLESVEYAIIGALIAAALVTAVVTLRTAIVGKFTRMETDVNNS